MPTQIPHLWLCRRRHQSKANLAYLSHCAAVIMCFSRCPISSVPSSTLNPPGHLRCFVLLKMIWWQPMLCENMDSVFPVYLCKFSMKKAVLDKHFPSLPWVMWQFLGDCWAPKILPALRTFIFPGLSMTLLSWQWLIFDLTLTCQFKQCYLHSLFLQFYNFEQNQGSRDQKWFLLALPF